MPRRNLGCGIIRLTDSISIIMNSKIKNRIQEDTMCLVAGLIILAWLMALAVGDGRLGFFDLF